MGSMHDYIYEGYDDKREGCLPMIAGQTTFPVVLFTEILIMHKYGLTDSKYAICFLPIVIIIALAASFGIKAYKGKEGRRSEKRKILKKPDKSQAYKQRNRRKNASNNARRHIRSRPRRENWLRRGNRKNYRLCNSNRNNGNTSNNNQ